MAIQPKNAKLILENGTCLEGFFFGFFKETYGECVFNTATTGYEELITDPSYNQQIVIMTFPIQGIYGVAPKFYESNKIQISGLVVDTYDDEFQHFESSISLSNALESGEIPGISGIDTRYLVKIIREHGSLKGAIVPIESNTMEVVKKLKNLNISNHVEKVQPNTLINNAGPDDQSKPKLIVYNFGCKQGIINELKNIGFNVIIVPWNTKYSEIKKIKHDGIFLSNGPGNPLKLTSVIKEIKLMIKNSEKIIGICLGNQLISLALNGKIYKLTYGHHSINHPVKDLKTGKVFITSQNHNYAIKENSLNSDVEIWMESLNDKSIEGIYSTKYNVLSCQFHPEAGPGPADSKWIFKKFYDFIKVNDGK